MTQYLLKVNNSAFTIEAWDGGMPLLYALRNSLRLTGTKFGCGLGQCGACTVLLDGQPARSCLVRLVDAVGKSIITNEGLGTPDKPHPVQAAFIAEQAAQCGYCTNGMVMTSVALLLSQPKANREQAKNALVGNLCRCGSHERILNAIARVAKEASK